MDKQGKHPPIAPVIPATAAEKRRYEEAGHRRENRLQMRNRSVK
jgi:hypothetical protein